MQLHGLDVASTGLATLSCGTDNQGNAFFLDRLMATKLPLVRHLAGAFHAALPYTCVPTCTLASEATE